MTPRYFHFLRKRKREVQRHSDFMLAQIRAGVENFSMMRGKEERTPMEFMPTEQKPKVKRSTLRHSRQAIADAFRAFAGAHSGTQG